MARGVWKGTLSFGLVSIGVELHPAEEAERLDLDLLDSRDMARIGYQKINKSTGRVVDPKHIVRGYEVSKGHYVLLTPKDLKAANPKATQTIDVIGFVDADEIPLIYYAKPYVIAPLKGSEKVYVLFREALEASGHVALAQLVIHTRQYMAAVYPHGQTLVVQLLRYADELKPSEQLDLGRLPAPGKAVRPAEMAMAKQLMASMETSFKPESYKDEYHDDVLKLIKQRAKSRSRKVAEEPEVEAPDESNVIDLMSALKKSLAGRGGARKAPAKRRRSA